ncbi:MAG: VWA domain-containing protein [Veillonellaceae bacterium]|nr:VWA domain-containing protein [Veillonellaceae bacterium]
MAFNPNNYKAPEAKKLPVILLLDVSGSMCGAKIDSLYDATIDMIGTFVAAQAKEQIIDVAIITFGDSVDLHTSYTPVKDLQEKGISKFVASGMTPMGTALRMAKDMIEDKNVTPSRIYRPAVVLVSDGGPNDSWERPMDEFINDGRSAKCQRFAVAIGNDADRSVLERFTQDPNAVLFAEDAKDISEQFKTISMSISTMASTPDSKSVPKPSVEPKYDDNSVDDDDLF